MVKEHLTVENHHDMEAMLATLADENPVRDEISGKVYRGQNEVAARYAELWTAFPDFNVSPTLMIEGDNTVMIEADYTGTHKGALNGHAPTNRKFKCRIVVVFRFVSEKIESESIYMDIAGQYRQLGLPLEGVDGRAGKTSTSAAAS